MPGELGAAVARPERHRDAREHPVRTVGDAEPIATVEPAGKAELGTRLHKGITRDFEVGRRNPPPEFDIPVRKDAERIELRVPLHHHVPVHVERGAPDVAIQIQVEVAIFYPERGRRIENKETAIPRQVTQARVPSNSLAKATTQVLDKRHPFLEAEPRVARAVQGANSRRFP